ncbi:MAG TPA: two-component regulator propeller domain-containing protein, partial [Pyrinomonadaceae bacterium]|nr:two-component regulator propeller domain-containing protein [Pyrinomonadaceae bacterium]
MAKTPRQALAFISRSIGLSFLLAACYASAHALNPELDVSQYAHTSWKIRDGFFRSSISSIVQTPDGYLWLGTEAGLLRFDGVRNLPWQPPAGQQLPSPAVMSLLVTRDGTLWIGTQKGLSSWKDGTLTHHPELAGQFVFKLIEDREGSVWASGVSPTTGRLCEFQRGSVHCYGDDGVLGRGAFNLYEDSKGNLWAGVKDGIWRWRPGPPKFYPLPGELNGIRGIGENDDGTLLVGWHGGIQRFVEGKTEVYPLPGFAGQLSAKRILRDHDGGLWIGTQDRGVVHLHKGKADVFSLSEGLSGKDVYSIFEDREGSIWVASADGLDRFRDYAVATLSLRQGLSHENVGSILAATDGSVWLGTFAGLNRWENEKFSIPRTGSGREDGKLNGRSP